MVSQKMTELFLRAAADPDDNVPRSANIDLRQQLAVFDCRAVTWRDVKIDISKWKMIGAQPAYRLFVRRFVRKNPKNAARFVGKQTRAEMLKVFQARDAPDFSAAQNFPKQHQCAAVGDAEIGMRHRFAISRVAAQPGKTCPRWRNQKTAVAKHELDCLIDMAVEETKAEDLLRSRHREDVEQWRDALRRVQSKRHWRCRQARCSGRETGGFWPVRRSTPP